MTPNWIVSLAENGGIRGVTKVGPTKDHFIFLSKARMNVGIFALLLSVVVAYDKARIDGMYDLNYSVRRIRDASGRVLLLFVRPIGRRGSLSSP